MKNQHQKSQGLLLALLVAVLAIALVFFKIERDRQIEVWQEQEWFAFSNDLEMVEDTEYILIEEIKEYKPKTELYSSNIYYNAISQEEKIIYNAYLYALDNNYEYTYIDEALVKGENSPLDILVMLSLDSGLIQQNTSSVEYDSSQRITSNILGTTVYKDIAGFTVSSKAFLEESVEKAQQAADELKRIDFGFSSKTTQKEKAEEIFRYVQTNLNYSSKYENVQKAEAYGDFLYDAVFGGETNCDGFANVFSILCSLNGIECFEKNSDDSGEVVGHTWNVAKIDGQWYNVDCTESVNEPTSEIETNLKLKMGFGDSMQEQKPRFSSLVPVCSSGIVKPAAIFNYCGNETYSFAADKIKANKTEPVMILIKSSSEKDIENFAQRVANKIGGSVKYFSYKVIGCRVVVIEKK